MAKADKILERIAVLERQVSDETEKLRALRFDAELLQSRLSEATFKWGSNAEKELLTHPKFTGLISRLVLAM